MHPHDDLPPWQTPNCGKRWFTGLHDLLCWTLLSTILPLIQPPRPYTALLSPSAASGQSSGANDAPSVFSLAVAGKSPGPLTAMQLSAPSPYVCNVLLSPSLFIVHSSSHSCAPEESWGAMMPPDRSVWSPSSLFVTPSDMCCVCRQHRSTSPAFRLSSRILPSICNGSVSCKYHGDLR